ncbi:MAG: TlpA family protein disulfide reductase [Solirubrobacterales bacterium]|nr:TlpA family protein disulfide reductase [Solirubrobacterales bacterium]
MRRFGVPAAVVAVAIGLLAVLAFGISQGGTNNSIAYSVQSKHYRLAPGYDTKLPFVQGGTGNQSLAAFRGKVVLVNFFAHWCDPCKAEAPELKRAQKLLAAHGGTVLGVTFQDAPSDAERYLHQYHLSYPVLQDSGGNLASAFSVTGAPDTYVLDRQGKIVAATQYQITSGWLNKTLPRLL